MHLARVDSSQVTTHMQHVVIPTGRGVQHHLPGLKVTSTSDCELPAVPRPDGVQGREGGRGTGDGELGGVGGEIGEE